MAGFQILGISGSLRRQSYNTALLRAAQEVLPEGVTLDLYDGLRAIPPYDDDVRLQGDPAVVAALKDQIRAADALLIATPEYNYSISGVLKNAIDWASRPMTETPLRFKPVAITGVATGNFGTVRAQVALRQILSGASCYVMPKPELLVFGAANRFDDQGRLTDDATRGMLKDLLTGLVDWAKLVGRRE